MQPTQSLPAELKLTRASEADVGKVWSALRGAADCALPEFLMQQRWYPAKDAGTPTIQLKSLLPFAGAEPLLSAVALWQATPPGRPPLLLFVPLALIDVQAADPAQVIATVAREGRQDGDLALVDACSVDEFLQAWLEVHLHAQPGAALPEALRAGHTDRLAQLEIGSLGRRIKRGHAEQSNTSIRFGEHLILKILRKLEEGPHPELEVGRALAARGFTATAPLLSWVDLTGAAATGVTLSLLQSFVPNEGDGWSWVLERLGRAARGEHCALEDTRAWLRTLAHRTAELHRTFALATDEPEFRPEPVGEDDLRKWANAARAMAERAFKNLESKESESHGGEDTCNTADRELQLIAQLRALRLQIMERLEQVTSVSTAFIRTRHHGDFHLGQVLVSARDAVIIDFEGEPLRPLAERRAKHAVLRDVAGMLRSLSYVAAAAERALSETLSVEERRAAATLFEGWEAQASAAFTADYLIAMEGVPSIPAQRSDAERLLNFFLLEKALYEIVYESAARPEWVAIPIRGVMSLIREGSSRSRRAHAMPFGAQVRPQGGVRFRLWAPSHPTIQVELDRGAALIPMSPLAEGWHELVTDRALQGARYSYVLPDGVRVPDPASRFQPDDVHGPSEVVDPATYTWRHPAWRGRPWEEAVIYELHVGAFTPEGTFRAVLEKLDHLQTLGVTALELMPIADFPGRRNWGYDGVSLYAPDASYGRPEELKELVDAAHGRGLMVLLDVVYNHFGPEGAYIHSIAPQTFTQRHQTPWGAAINTDGEHSGVVREFFIQNALYWIEEFCLDGLRLDAVHAILDESPKHLLEELAERIKVAEPDRHVHLILENEENESRLLTREPDGRPSYYSAQWNDDVHHVLHVAVTGEGHGYYADYQGDSVKLGRALAEGFAFQGELMPYRGRARGRPSAALPPVAFVTFIQNHDQIGNRAFGERLTVLTRPEALRAAAAVYLLLPQIPMLFMGEEWGTSRPFAFFCDFEPVLAEAVRTGRRAEFARFPEFQDAAMRELIPDPTAEQTFTAAKLDWNALAREPHSGWYNWYRRLLEVRHREIVPRLKRIRSGGRFEVLSPSAVAVHWSLGTHGGELILEANLSDRPVSGFSHTPAAVVWEEGTPGPNGVFAPHSVRYSLEGVRDIRKGE